MIQYTTDALKYEAFHGSLSILEREMNVVLSYLENVGTQAALILGMAFVFFSDGSGLDHSTLHPAASIIIMGSVAVAFGLMTYAVVASTVCCSLGPTMALKGADFTAMRKAVELMKADRTRIVVAFGVGVVAFFVPVMALSWLHLEENGQRGAGGVAVGVLSVCFLALAHGVYRMWRQYSTPAGPTLMPGGTGKVSGAEFLRKAEGASVTRLGVATRRQPVASNLASSGTRQLRMPKALSALSAPRAPSAPQPAGDPQSSAAASGRLAIEPRRSCLKNKKPSSGPEAECS